MRPLAYLILVILGVLCFSIHRFTGSFLCIIGSLFLLYSGWSLICAARPEMRGPNVKVHEGVSARTCIVSAVYAFAIGAVICLVGFKFKI
jgi:threonine/homoserine/homoserine lactone efflux protein